VTVNLRACHQLRLDHDSLENPQRPWIIGRNACRFAGSNMAGIRFVGSTSSARCSAQLKQSPPRHSQSRYLPAARRPTASILEDLR
jgi:hypothetical protein